MKKIYLLLVLVAVFLSTASVYAQAFGIDASFGNNGKIVDSFGTPHYSQPLAVIVQFDGKIVAGGYRTVNNHNELVLARYSPDGIPDSSFGTNGKVMFPYTSIGTNKIQSLTQQPDGKIVAGAAIDSFRTPGTLSRLGALLRFNTNGTLDSSLAGSGVIVVNTPVVKVAVRPNGKIIVIDGDMFQLKPAGVLDSSFGFNGYAYYGLSDSVTTYSLALLPDGKMVMTGYKQQPNNFPRQLLRRYHENGTKDSSFGVNGSVVNSTWAESWGSDLAVLSDSTIITVGLISGAGYPNVGLLKYHYNGSLDSSFGTDGYSGVDILHRNASPHALHMRPDGKIVVIGGAWNGRNNGCFITRLHSNGALDKDYGRHGIVISEVSGIEYLTGSSAMQPDGKMIVCGHENLDSPYYKWALARYESEALFNYNTLAFDVFLDRNADGVKDTTEPFFVNSTAIISKQGSTTYLSSATGKYEMDIDTGVYKTHVVPSLPYYNAVPAMHTTSLSSYFNTDSFSIAMQPIPGKKDVSIAIVPLSTPRPGFWISYRIVCTNNGTDTVSGTFRMIKDSRLIYQSANPVPSSIAGDTVEWGYSSLPPLTTLSATVQLKLKTPPDVNIGDTIFCTADAAIVAGENSVKDNVVTLWQIVRGSIDPNDKTESHAGKITTTQVSNGDYLTYTIRFQNTGNDTAFNVFIHDTLSDKVDLSTFEMLTSSANYQMSLNDGKCVWIFNNINLVDSIHNEPLSHGYLVYRIKPKANVQVGDIINNGASIYFDYNLPVKTNTEMTTVVADILPLKLLVFTAKKEGKTNLLNWTSANEVNVDRFEVERSFNSREFGMIGKVKSQNTVFNQYNFTDNFQSSIPPLGGGGAYYYRLKMIDKDGQFTYSPVRMLNNSGTFSVSIYPNPTKDNLQVQIDSDKKTTLQLQVVAQDGKVLLSQQWNVNGGSILRTIGISNLQSGTYFIKVTSADNEQCVVKFEKI